MFKKFLIVFLLFSMIITGFPAFSGSFVEAENEDLLPLEKSSSFVGDAPLELPDLPSLPLENLSSPSKPEDESFHEKEIPLENLSENKHEDKENLPLEKAPSLAPKRGPQGNQPIFTYSPVINEKTTITGLTAYGLEKLKEDGYILKLPVGTANNYSDAENEDNPEIIGVEKNAFRGLGIKKVVLDPRYSYDLSSYYTLLDRATYTIGENAFAYNEITEFPFNMWGSQDPNTRLEVFIGDGAFFDNKLTRLDLPVKNPYDENLDILYYIGDKAFYSNLLTEVHLGKIAGIGEYAFSGFVELPGFSGKPLGNQIATLSLSNGEAEDWGYELSQNDGAMKRNIKPYAFYNNKIKSLSLHFEESSKLPDLILGDFAFAKNEIQSIDFGLGTDYELILGSGVFQENKLKTLDLSENLPHSTSLKPMIESIPDDTFFLNPSSLYPSPVKIKTPEGNPQNFKDVVTNEGGHIINPADNEEIGGVWKTSDFIYDEEKGLVTGFSPEGAEKAKTNSFLYLPLMTNGGRIIRGTGESAFKGNQDIKGLVIPSKYYTFIGESSFENVGGGAGLTELSIPSNILNIEKNAFKNTKIGKITLDDGLLSIGDGAFSDSHVKTIVYNKTLLSIGEEAFKNNELEEITLPESLKSLGKRAFFESKQARKITLYSGLRSIPEEAFSYAGLENASPCTEISFSDDIKVIKTGAFSFSKICALSLKEGLSSIGEDAFRGNALSDVTFPITLKDLHPTAFYENKPQNTEIKVVNLTSSTGANPYHLEDSIDPLLGGHKIISESEDSIGGGWAYDDFLYDNETLLGFSSKGLLKLQGGNTKVSIPSYNPFTPGDENARSLIPNMESWKPLLTIQDGAFQQSVLGGAFISSLEFTVRKDGTGFKTIGSHAFEGNSLNSLRFISSPKAIKTAAFKGNLLKKVEFLHPENVVTLESEAFKNNLLEMIDLASMNHLTTIGDEAFSENKLTVLSIPESLSNLSDTAFLKNPKDEAHLPVELYTLSGENPHGLRNHQEADGGHLIHPPKNLTTEDFLYNGTTVLGFSEKGLIKAKVSKVCKIPRLTPEGEKVTAIDANAFKSLGLLSVVIPSSITFIGERAFDNNALSSVLTEKEDDTLTETLSASSIGDFAFYRNKLKQVSLEGTKALGAFTFAKNEITSFTPDKSLESMGTGVFNDNLIKTLDLSGTALTKLPEEAFMDNKLTDVVLGEKIKTIQDRAFQGNFISKMDLSQIEVLGNSAFDTNKIGEVHLDSIISLGQGVFAHNGRNVFARTEKDIKGEVYDDGFALVINPINIVIKFQDTEGKTIRSDLRLGNNPYQKHVDFELFKPVEYPVPNVKGYRPVKNPLVFTPSYDNFEVVAVYQDVSIPPTLTVGNKNFLYSPTGTITKEDLLEGVIAKDFEGNDISSAIQVTPESISLNKEGTTKVTYSVKDAYGNVTTKEITVSVSSDLNTADIGFGWTYDDFEYDGKTVVGFSVQGENKLLSSNPPKDLAVPDKNPVTLEPITKVGLRAFSSYNKKRTDKVRFNSVLLPSSLVEISHGAFEGNNLEKAEIPVNVTWIGDGAFYENALKEIILPPGLEHIGSGAFSALNKDIGWGGSDSTLPSNAISKGIILPPNLKYIGDYAFYKQPIHKDGKDFVFPDKLTTIGKSAFEDTGLSGELVMSKSLLKIGDRAFKDNLLSGNLTLYEGLKEIGSEAFQTTDKNEAVHNSISSVHFPLSLVKIGEEAFEGNEIKHLILPENVKEVGGRSFFGNPLTKVELYSPTTMPYQSYADAKELDEAIIGKNKTEIFEREFLGEDPENDENNLIHVKKVVLLDGLKRVNRKAFYRANVEELDLSDAKTLTVIGGESFGHDKIKSVDFSACKDLKSISYASFMYNEIASIDLSGLSKLEYIRWQAFAYNKIPSVDFTGLSSLKRIGFDAFLENKITDINFTGCTSLSSIGVGSFQRNQLTSVDFSPLSSLELIDGHYYRGAFEQNKITNLNFSDCSKLTTIGMDAFSKNQLTYVNLSPLIHLKMIDKYAFHENQLTDVEFSECKELETIEAGAFRNNHLTYVDLSPLVSLKTLEDRAYKRNNLTGLNLNAPKLETIGDFAFAENPGMADKRVPIPYTLKQIGETLFSENDIPHAVLTSPVKFFTADGTNPQNLPAEDPGRWVLNVALLSVSYLDENGVEVYPPELKEAGSGGEQTIVAKPSPDPEKYHEPTPSEVKITIDPSKNNAVVFTYKTIAYPTMTFLLYDKGKKAGDPETLIPLDPITKVYKEGTELNYQNLAKEFLPEGYRSVSQKNEHGGSDGFLVERDNTTIKLYYSKIEADDYEVSAYTYNPVGLSHEYPIGEQMIFMLHVNMNNKIPAGQNTEGENPTIEVNFNDLGDAVDLESFTVSPDYTYKDLIHLDKENKKLVFDLKGLPSSYSAEIPLYLKFKPYKTPNLYEIKPTTRFLLCGKEAGLNSSFSTYKPDSAVLIGNLLEKPVITKYFNANKEDGARDIGEVDGIHNYVVQNPETPPYAFAVSELKRDIIKVYAEDTISSYEAWVPELGIFEMRPPLFDPVKNPDWRKEGDKFIYEKTYKEGTHDVNIPPLYLSFPGAKLGQNIKNTVNATMTPENIGEKEEDFQMKDSLTIAPQGKPGEKGWYTKFITDPPRVSDNEKFFYDVPEDRNKDFYWTINIYEPGLKAPIKDPSFIDTDLDERMFYAGVRMNYPSITSGIFKAYSEKNGTGDVLETLTISDGETHFFSSENAPNIKSVSFLPLSGDSLDEDKTVTDSFFFQVISRLKEPEKAQFDENGNNFYKNKATCFFTWKNSGEAGTISDSDTLGIQKINYQVQAKLHLTGPTTSINRTLEVGFEDKGKEHSGISLKLHAYKALVLLPSGVLAENVTMSPAFSSAPGAKVEVIPNYQGNQTGVLFTADEFIPQNLTEKVGEILVKPLPSENAREISAQTYQWWSDENVEKLSPSSDVNLGGGSTSKDSVVYQAVSSMEASPMKYISNDKENWEVQIVFSNIKEDENKAVFYYRLTMLNNSGNRRGLVLKDKLPALNDGRGTEYTPEFYQIEKIPENFRWDLSDGVLTIEQIDKSQVVPSDFEVIYSMKTPVVTNNIDERFVYNNFTWQDSSQEEPLISNVVSGVFRADPPKLEIKKIDKNTKVPLSGAEFSLYNRAGVVSQKGLTDKDGKLLLELPKAYRDYGYVLKETGAPLGYQKNNSEFPVPLDIEGGETRVLIIENTPVPTVNASFDKVSGMGHPIPGVSFRLKGVSSNNRHIAKTLTSDKNGKVSIKDVPLGDYELLEISSPGVILRDMNLYKIRLNENPKPILLKDNDEEGGALDQIVNRHGAMMLYKLGVLSRYRAVPLSELTKNHGELLTAKFRLFKIENGTEVPVPVNNEEEFEVTPAGLRLYLELEKTYVLKETSLLDGYENTPELRFFIGLDGRIKTVDGQTFASNPDVFYPNIKLPQVKLTKLGLDPSIGLKPNKTYVKPHLLEARHGKILSGTKFNLYENGALMKENFEVPLSGILLEKLKFDALYRLEEITTPEGYETGEPLEFKFNEEGKLITKDGESFLSQKEIFFPNVKKGKIKLFKLSVDPITRDVSSSSYKELNEFTPEFGTLVEGSVITLKRGDTVISDLEVPSEGLEVSGLLYNVLYTLEEKTAPEGLLKDGPIFFKIGYDGKIRNEFGNPFPYDSNIYFPNQKSAGFTLKKLGINPNSASFNKDIPELLEKDGTLLDGAIFEIYDENGKLVIPEFTVPKTGFEVKGLRYTKLYELREKTPPTGYEISSKSVWFKISYDGTVCDKKGRPFAGRNIVYIPNQEKGVLSSVYLKKLNDQGAILSGAEFTLYKKNKDESYSELEKKISDGNGMISFSLPGGTYRLMETKAPLGFVKSNEMKEFILPYFGNAKTLSFNMKNYKLRLNIQKISIVEKGIPYDRAENIIERLKSRNPEALYEIEGDGASGQYRIIKKLSGAKFQLKDASGNVIGEAESDIQGNVVFKHNGVLVPIKDGEEYTIEEIKAPKNYVISEKPFTFNTHDYSNLKNFNGTINLSLENTRQESSITVVKRFLFNSKRLEGAKFQLSYARPGMNERIVYGEGFTNEEGIVVFRRLNSDFSNVELVENTFFVKEMTPPTGFSNNGLEKVVRFKDPTDSELVTFYNTSLNLSWYPNTGTLMGFGFAGLGGLAILLSKRMKKRKKGAV